MNQLKVIGKPKKMEYDDDFDIISKMFKGQCKKN